jgi:glucose-1-phosphate thymidylyltransferase
MSEELVGLVPAAGKGVRLGLPYPKELYPVIRDKHYKPIAQFVVENLTLCGVSDIVFVINETKHQLVGYFGSGRRFGCNFSYVVQESRGSEGASTSPGLAHALDSAYHLARGKTVLFGMADTIMEPPDVFAHLLNAARPEDQVVLGLFGVSRPGGFGMVQMADDASVLKIVDKPASSQLRLAWGCMVWRPDFTEYLHYSVNNERTSDFAEVMNNAMVEGIRFRGCALEDGRYFDLGTYEEIVELEAVQAGRGVLTSSQARAGEIQGMES